MQGSAVLEISSSMLCFLPTQWTGTGPCHGIKGAPQGEDICRMILCFQNLDHHSTSLFAFLCANPPVPSAFFILYLHF